MQGVKRWFLVGMCVALMAFLIGSGWSRVVGQGGSSDAAPMWASPGAMAIKKVSSLSGTQAEPNFLSNTDCMLLTYHLVADKTMRTGCFTEAAYGLVDTDSGVVIFNGTDEGLPLQPYSSQEVLAPWPQALDVLALDSASTGGSYVSLYKNPLAHLEEQRNVLGQLTGKRLTAAPEQALLDTNGQHLIANAQSLAFSGSGSWLVAESLNGSFLRINLATLDSLPFAHSFAALGGPGLFKSQVAISDDGHYAVINNEAAGSFKVYDLANCSAAQAGNCPAFEYRPFFKQQLPGLQYIRHLRFVNEGLLSFEATSSNGSESGSYVLAPTATITSLTDYLGLGDSYTSGEGAFDYRAGTDRGDNNCHLSGVSYPLLLSRDLFGGGGHSVACSGAVINDVSSTSGNYYGQVEHSYSYDQLQHDQPALLESVEVNFVPGYIAQHRFAQRYQPRVITVSVGGDDVGFGDMVQTCVLPHLAQHTSDNTCFNTYESRLEITNLIDRTVKRWQGLYAQLAREAPFASIYTVGYPDIISDTGNCALNVHLDQSEREFAKEVVAYLNQAIAKAAHNAGVHYVDISKALLGHRLCEAASFDVAVNGLTAGKDAGLLGLNFLGKESYHPNALGQQLMEQAILQQTHNFTTSSSATGVSDASGSILNKPKSGRAVAVRVFAPKLTKRLVHRGGTVHLSLSGSGVGIASHRSYTVTIGDNGPVLGAITSDAEGSLEGEVTIPDTLEPGGHTIEVTGSNQAGDLIDMTQPIYVDNAPQDRDGDGIPDVLDSCPTVLNSNQDTDQDGIDDACDGFIGHPPTPPAGSGTGSGTASTPSSPDNGAGSTPVNLAAEVSRSVATFTAMSTVNASALPKGSRGVTLQPTTHKIATFKLPVSSKHQAITTLGASSAPEHSVPHAALPRLPWLWWSGLLIVTWWLLLLIVELGRRLQGSREQPSWQGAFRL